MTADRIVALGRLHRAEYNIQTAAEAALNNRTQKAEILLEMAMTLLKKAAAASDDLDSAPQVDRVRRVSIEITNCIRTHAELTIRNLDRLSEQTEDLYAQFESQSDQGNASPKHYRTAQGEAA